MNHAKYHFKRMPFGLKNAPSIFQRCVNEILKKFIGKFVYVYIDDVLIFSNSIEEHMIHISLVTKALYDAHMKISNEKCHFFKDKIEFLGHIISHNKITVDPTKIETIRDYPVPVTLKQLRSFLGLSGYYRKFIRDYAKLTKPLTIHLRGDNGGIKANQSAKIAITLDDAALEAFKRIKNFLQEKVELYQPDFTKPFELTTDASNFAVGAVLSQDRHPITFISRTLSSTEQNYATNEKEILAIVWALQKLRNYLYGIADGFNHLYRPSVLDTLDFRTKSKHKIDTMEKFYCRIWCRTKIQARLPKCRGRRSISQPNQFHFNDPFNT